MATPNYSVTFDDLPQATNPQAPYNRYQGNAYEQDPQADPSTFPNSMRPGDVYRHGTPQSGDQVHNLADPNQAPQVGDWARAGNVVYPVGSIVRHDAREALGNGERYFDPATQRSAGFYGPTFDDIPTPKMDPVGGGLDPNGMFMGQAETPDPTPMPYREQMAHVGRFADDSARAFANHVPVLGSWANEMEAGTSAGLEALQGGDPNTAFTEAMRDQNAMDARFKHDQPGIEGAMGGAGTVLGSLALGRVLPGAPADTSVIGRAGWYGAQGGGLGAIQGAGDGDTLGERGMNAATQGGGGFALGAAFPLAGAAAKTAWESSGGKLFDALAGKKLVGGLYGSRGDTPIDQIPEPVMQGARRAPGRGAPNRTPPVSSLPIDEAARIGRAKEMGFYTDIPLFHGTASDFPAFSKSELGRTTGAKAAQQGVWSARDPERAGQFAQLATGTETNAGPNILPLFHRAQKPGQITLEGTETDRDVAATISDAFERGHDAILVESPGGVQTIIVRDPQQLRSRFAIFDPAKRNSPDLLAATRTDDGKTAFDTERLKDAMAARVYSPTVEVPASAERGAYDKLFQALERQQMTPEQAVDQVKGLGTYGMMADVGGIGGKGAVSDLARAVTNRQSQAGSIANRALSVRQEGVKEGGQWPIRSSSMRLRDAMAERLGFGGRTAYSEADALSAQQKDKAGPLYKKFQAADPIETAQLGSFEGPDLQKAYQRARDISTKEFVRMPDGSERIQALPEAMPERLDWRTLDLMKQGLDDMVGEAKREGIGANAQHAMKGFRDRFRSHLDILNPDYQAARDAFSGPAAVKDAMEQGRRFFKDDAEVSAKAMDGMSPSEAEGFKLGAYQSYLEKMEGADVSRGAARLSGALQPAQMRRFRELFGSDADLAAFDKLLTNERQMFDTNTAIGSGSTSAKQIGALQDAGEDPLASTAVTAITGGKAGLIGALMKLTKKGDLNALDEPTANALAGILFDMDPRALPKILDGLSEAEKRRMLAAALARSQGSGAAGATGQAADLLDNQKGPR